MNPSQIITNGIATDDLLAAIREIVHSEVQAIPKPEKIKPFLSLTEAAELVGLSKSSLYQLTSKKQIPHLKRGGKLLFNRDQLIAWIQLSQQQTIDE
jgi:excisionase family DNA binding protein